MMNKKSVRDVNLKNKRVLMRVDFNVPMNQGVVQDDTRIRAALPTIRYILDQGAKTLVLMSHLGDPDKDIKKAREKAEKENKAFDEARYLEAKHKMAPVAAQLETLLGRKVKLAKDCISQETQDLVASLRDGDILMLENTRFHKEEKSKIESERESMAKILATYGDIYVNDAFGTAHRPHVSTETVARFLPAVAGFLIEKELEFLEEKVVRNPVKPFAAIIGGAKVSSKIAVLESLISKVDKIIIGGGMAYTFLKARGVSVGNSLVEDDMVNTAGDILRKGEETRVTILLPVDHVVTREFSASADSKVTEGDAISDGWMGMDIGPRSIEKFKGALKEVKTIFWNGPMGVFEFDKFAAGTNAIAKTLAELNDAIKVIGGGDSVSAVKKAGVADKMSHISTGGGASLELVEGKTLPGIAALDDA
jgi:3-phosphoglycerate kinase